MSNRFLWGFIIALIAWIGVFTVAYLYFASAQAPKVAMVSADSPEKEIIIPRSLDGHYYVQGKINGYPVEFMVDTGASIVSISYELARAIHLPPGIPANFSTAGGGVNGEIVPSVDIEIGNIRLNELTVSVGIQGKMALLGQNFLRRIDMIQSNDKMILQIRN
ncbi:MAG: TIGR02281 family clan AA aspartic protease [Nitrosomonas sp.]|nr:MAG: TIGR02281 family clan AA aspartic protease [Nitrosomonas sp.]